MCNQMFPICNLYVIIKYITNVLLVLIESRAFIAKPVTKPDVRFTFAGRLKRSSE